MPTTVFVVRDFTLTAEAVLSLPIDEVAMAVLRDAAANEEWNSYNWLLMASHEYPAEATRVLAEAWGWMRAKGLVATAPGQSSESTIFVTRLGHRVVAEGLQPMQAAERLGVDLHPRLADKVPRQFLMGEYELAAFAAMKQVEVRVREMTGLPSEAVGVPLMRKAFGDSGVLRDAAAAGGEQSARMELFTGAIGSFKNPTSHRDVVFDDPTEAAEVVLLADLLMRILDRIESGRTSAE